MLRRAAAPRPCDVPRGHSLTPCDHGRLPFAWRSSGPGARVDGAPAAPTPHGRIQRQPAAGPPRRHHAVWADGQSLGVDKRMCGWVGQVVAHQGCQRCTWSVRLCREHPQPNYVYVRMHLAGLQRSIKTESSGGENILSIIAHVVLVPSVAGRRHRAGANQTRLPAACRGPPWTRAALSPSHLPSTCPQGMLTIAPRRVVL